MRLIAPISLVILVSFMALPIVAILLAARSQRRLAKIASRKNCPRCGELLGAKALFAANQWKRELFHKLMNEHPDIRFRLNWTFDFICSACGAHSAYCKETGMVEGVEAPETDVAQAKVTP